jgi:hypothetical protein
MIGLLLKRSITSFYSASISHCDIEKRDVAIKSLKIESDRSKIVHFVRHAQGHHNVAGLLDPVNGYLKDEFEDAGLTELGTISI